METQSFQTTRRERRDGSRTDSLSSVRPTSSTTIPRKPLDGGSRVTVRRFAERSSRIRSTGHAYGETSKQRGWNAGAPCNLHVATCWTDAGDLVACGEDTLHVQLSRGSRRWGDLVAGGVCPGDGKVPVLASARER